MDAQPQAIRPKNNGPSFSSILSPGPSCSSSSLVVHLSPWPLSWVSNCPFGLNPRRCFPFSLAGNPRGLPYLLCLPPTGFSFITSPRTGRLPHSPASQPLAVHSDPSLVFLSLSAHLALPQELCLVPMSGCLLCCCLNEQAVPIGRAVSLKTT